MCGTCTCTHALACTSKHTVDSLCALCTCIFVILCQESSIVLFHTFSMFLSVSKPACLYYCGLAGSFVLQFLHGTVQACNSALSAFGQMQAELIIDKEATVPVNVNENSEGLRCLLNLLACHLPLIKIWFDWLCCQLRLWYDCSQQINDVTQ